MTSLASTPSPQLQFFFYGEKKHTNERMNWVEIFWSDEWWVYIFQIISIKTMKSKIFEHRCWKWNIKINIIFGLCENIHVRVFSFLSLYFVRWLWFFFLGCAIFLFTLLFVVVSDAPWNKAWKKEKKNFGNELWMCDFHVLCLWKFSMPINMQCLRCKTELILNRFSISFFLSLHKRK